MYKIKAKDIYKGHFTSSFSRYIMASIIQGFTMADIYVDQPESPRITIVWDGKHGLYCGGNADKETLLGALGFVMHDILTPQTRLNSAIVKIAFENAQWKEALLESMGGIGPNVYQRSIYRHRLSEVPDFACKDAGITVKRIDEEMLYSGKISNVQGVIDEVSQMWGSAERFLESGFGYCALKDGSIAGFCTCEYLSNTSCGIGIETYEQYQRLGVAKAMTSRMLNYCKVMEKTPYWDCWKNNIASARTAETMGFEKLADYDIVFVRFA